MLCVVLLSAFNGEPYIAEQVQSILCQLPSDGMLIVRDDGSSDGTVACVRRFDDARITVIEGENIGFARSFFALFARAPQGADIYLLADQDDVWLPDKLARAWAVLQHAGTRPTLYCGNPLLVSADLQPLGVARKSAGVGGLMAALVDNQVTGCTVAFNAALLQQACPPEHVQGALHFHDWWLYVVATLFGVVHHDAVPTVLYRQHEHNVIGAGAGWLKYLKMLRYVRHHSWVAACAAQLRVVQQLYGERLTAAQQACLAALWGPHGLRRWAIGCRTSKHRSHWGSELLFRSLVLADWRHGPPKDWPEATSRGSLGSG